MKKTHRKVESRNKIFSRRPISHIWQEDPCEENPYIAKACRCHGYDLLELIRKKSFVEVLFLLFQGELPNADQACLLEQLMIGLLNPGPRHPAARAAMLTAASKTDPAHLLPISLTILGGTHLGAGEVEGAMQFLQAHTEIAPEKLVRDMLNRKQPKDEGDWHPFPGFGCRFGGMDILTGGIAGHLATLPGAGKFLSWGNSLATILGTYQQGWLPTGLAAAVFSDLGFHPKTGAGLFQYLCAPGLLAHGFEFIDQPMTSMPFPNDEEYFIEEDR